MKQRNRCSGCGRFVHDSTMGADGAPWECRKCGLEEEGKWDEDGWWMPFDPNFDPEDDEPPAPVEGSQ